MKAKTKARMKEILISFVKSAVEVPYSIGELKRTYIFHLLLFPSESIKAFKK